MCILCLTGWSFVLHSSLRSHVVVSGCAVLYYVFTYLLHESTSTCVMLGRLSIDLDMWLFVWMENIWLPLWSHWLRKGGGVGMWSSTLMFLLLMWRPSRPWDGGGTKEAPPNWVIYVSRNLSPSCSVFKLKTPTRFSGFGDLQEGGDCCDGGGLLAIGWWVGEKLTTVCGRLRVTHRDTQ